MAVGVQASTTQVNNQLTQLSVQLRDVCEAIRNLQTFVVQQGQSGLETIGFSAEDATAVLTQASYMNTIAGCYFGTVQQGGSGGTGAVEFDFDNELSQLWACQ